MIALIFTEEMKGYLALGESDPEAGFIGGKRSATFFMFHLTIAVADVDAFLHDRRHEATARGWVRCDELGGTLAVDQATFNLFVDDERPGLTRMFYRLFFVDSTGRPLTMVGVKEIEDQPGPDLWPDTTTCHIRLLAGHVAEAEEVLSDVVAAGKIQIYLPDFARLLGTMRLKGGTGRERRLAAAAFGRFFLGRLWEIYAPLARRQEREIRVETTIDAPPERVWEVLVGREPRPEGHEILLRFPPAERVLEVDPPRRLRWVSHRVPGLFGVERTLRLEALEGGRTHFAQSAQGSTPMARALFPLLGKPIEEGYENRAAALAARVEAG